MTWWAWMILGAFLFCAELFAIDAQFFLVFLGLSAALVGLLDVLGISMPEWAQWLVFAALSLISMFSFRKSLYSKIHGGAVGFGEGVTGESLVIPEDLEEGQTIRASFRGSNWTVVNEGTSSIKQGAQAKITRSEGLTLFVGDDTNQ